MSRSIPRAPALTALALAVALTTACAPTVEPAPTVESTAPVEPAPVVADEPTPEPDETTEPAPEPQPVPAAVIEEAQKVGGGAAPSTGAEFERVGHELHALARDTQAETGRRLVFVMAGGAYGWEGELVGSFYGFTRFFPELQSCQDTDASTVDEAVALAEECIAATSTPDAYEVVVLT